MKSAHVVNRIYMGKFSDSRGCKPLLTLSDANWIDRDETADFVGHFVKICLNGR